MSRMSREELIDGFVAEVLEYLPVLRDDLRHLMTDLGDRGRLRQVYRLFHNIKGAASQLTLKQVSGTARLVEDMLEKILGDGRAADLAEIIFFEGIAETIADHCRSGDLFNEQANNDLLAGALRTYHELTGQAMEIDAVGFRREFELLLSGRSIVASSPPVVLDELLEKTFNLVQQLAQIVSVSPLDREAQADLLRQLKQLVLAAENRAQEQGEDIPVSFTESFTSFIDWLADDICLVADQAVALLSDYLHYFQMLLCNGGQIESVKTERVIESMAQVRKIASMMTPDEDQAEFDQLFEEADFRPFDEEQENFSELLKDDDPALLVLPEVVEVADEARTPVETTISEDESDLKDIFRAESEEHLQTISGSLISLEQLVDTPCPISDAVSVHLAEMRRAVHTLKGAAGMVGYEELSRFAHRCEDLLDSFFERDREIRPQDISVLIEAADFMEMMAAHPEQVDGIAVEGLTVLIDALLEEQTPVDNGQVDSSVAVQPLQREELETASFSLEHDEPEETDELPVSSRPGLPDNDGAPDRQQVPAEDAEAPASVDSAHIRVRLERLDELIGLEGELIVVRSGIERRLVDLSQTVGELNFATEKLRTISQELESGFEVESLYGFGQGLKAAAGGDISPSAEFSEFDPIELDRYSKLHLIIRSLNELAVDVASIHHGIADLTNEMRGHVANQQLLMRVMQDKLMRVRMTPLSSLSRTFFRAVRSAATHLGKQVRLVVEGEDVFLDRYVWNKVADPIVHLLRNAVDHGIEEESVRLKAGKPSQGTIRMKAVQRGSHVLLEISDDGGGIDIGAIRNSLARRGGGDRLADMTETDLLEQLFVPGVTTREQVSRLSGRGIGLDVVKQNLNELRGSVRVQASATGTTFFLRIPVSLSINRAAIIVVGTERYAVPLQDILEIRKIPAADIMLGEPMQANVGGDILVLKDVATLFCFRDGLPGVQSDEADISVLVVEGERGNVALAIDGVVEQQEIIVKDLGTHLRHVRGVSGVTVMGDGSLVPILNVSELASVSESVVSTIEGEAKQEVSGPFTVMIVDDSVSVRQSVSRLVRNNGWEAILATDGVDAAEKIENGEPDAIILDIEMPRMNGFEFLGIVRSQSRYSSLPIIMLTSRFSEKHQQKAMDLGADHYIIKPYKEEQFVALLQRIANGMATSPEDLTGAR